MKIQFYWTRHLEKFGSQTIVAAIDFKKYENGEYVCVSNSSKKIIRKNPIDWAVECADRGAGEIILTSIDKDVYGGI